MSDTGGRLAILILAAGEGSRMRSQTPKVLHPIGALPMLGHALAAAEALSPERTILVVGAGAEAVGDYARTAAPGIDIVVQDPPQGTGDAVRQAKDALEEFSGAVVVLYADTPLVQPDTVRALAFKTARGAAVSVLGFSPDDPGAYGRLKRAADGALEAIVEAKDATSDELAIGLCNSGVMAIDSAFLAEEIGNISNHNAKGEYYLTDLVALARGKGRDCAVIEADVEEVVGVNSRAELAAAEAIFQRRKRTEALAAGATLLDPETVYFSFDTEIGADATIGQHVVFGPGVKIAGGAEIKAFSHLEGARVGEGASVGPFARLRPGAELGEETKVGNFVEIKKAAIGRGAKVSHLTYIGDAEIGEDANIGAGTITCNYDGYAKHKTTIGARAFIGSNTALVAPVTVGAGAYVGSGSVITKDVDADDLAVARGRQAVVKGWAARFRKAQGED